MAACSVFEEDVVYVITEKGYKCGLVFESCEYVSSDEEEENGFAYERVRKGTVRVAWHPKGDETVIQENQVQLADRSLMPGDVVRRLIKGKDSQRGYVRNTSVNCHMQVIGKNKVITNVNSKDLEPLRYWDPEPGDVTYDSWVGKIEHVNEEVTLRFPDGALCQVCDDEFINELFRFEDIHEKRPRDSEFCLNDYYPGQQLRGDLGDLDSAKWIKSTNTYSQQAAKKARDTEVTVTVDKVETKSLDVHWLCRGYAKAETPLGKLEAPPKTLTSEHLSKLRKLDCFEPCSVQIGDKAFYRVKSTDIVRSVHPNNSRNLIHQVMQDLGSLPDAAKCLEPPSIEEEQNAKNLLNNPEIDMVEQSSETVPTLNSTATEEVQDREDKTYSEPEAQNGMLEDPGAELIDDEDSDFEDEEDGCLSDAGSTASNASASSTSSQKKKKNKKGPALQTKLMRKKKLKRARRREGRRNKELQAGDRIPVEIIYTLSTVEVMWQDGSIEKNIPSTELFPIHHLDELEFFPGDFVIRGSDGVAGPEDIYGVVEKVDHAGRTCIVKWLKPYLPGSINKPCENIMPEEASVYDVKDHPDYKFRPGHVVVRVGGYDSSHSEAAGQVYELTQDGRLLIQWADNTRSYSCPQELYLIGDELAELGSELDSSTDESDEEEDSEEDLSSQGSWETEEEEEAMGATQEEENSEEKTEGDEEVLKVEPDRKIELDRLLETAKTTLQKLEDTFAQNVDICPCIIHCYREILRINRNCRDLDKMLEANYFEDAKLTSTISTIRKELKKEKAAKIARQVLELFESNCKQHVELEIDLGDKKKKRKHKEIGVKSEEVLPAAEDIGQCDKDGDSSCCGDSHVTQDGSEAAGDAGSGEGADGGNCWGAAAVPVADAQTETGATDDDKCSRTQAIHASLNPNSAKAKDLCQSACRLLKEQIMKVHEDLEKKWQKLKDAGQLHVLGEDDEDEEVEDEELDRIVAKAATAAGVTDEAITSPTKPYKPIVESDDMEAMDISPPAQVDQATDDSAKAEESNKDMRAGLGLDLNQSASEIEEMKQKVWEPPTPQTPAEIRAKILYNIDGFQLVEQAPLIHRFYASDHQPQDARQFFTALKKELKLLRTSLPIGIYVKGFEDRMDLYTIMIKGPIRTPYEDGLFFFDVQLPNDYPTTPPSVHYISYCSDRLNPNLYEDGKVCVSLLGTWAGKGTEMWTSKSSLLQVLISIQGLILVSEPYYNEAGYEKQKGTQQGLENSRMYNEMAICKMVQCMTKMLKNPPSVYESEVMDHMAQHGHRMIAQLGHFVQLSGFNESMSGLTMSEVPSSSEQGTDSPSEGACLPDQGQGDKFTTLATSESKKKSVLRPAPLGPPEFPLLPASRGFCITLKKHLEHFQSLLESTGIKNIRMKLVEEEDQEL